MTSPEALNTELERQILRQGRIEHFGRKEVRVYEKNPELSLQVLSMRTMFDDPRVRVNSAGVNFISRYMDKKDEKELDESQLRRVKDLKEVYRLWIPYPHGYPSVIRGTGKVERAYLPGGKEYESIRALGGHVETTLRKFQLGEIRTKEENKEVSEKTAEVLVATHFDTPVKPEKLEVRDRLERAMEVVDGMGRNNPSKSRLFYKYAVADLQELYYFEPKPRDKYGSINKKMLHAYIIARTNMEETRAMLLDFARTSARSQEYKNLARAAKLFVKDLLSDERVAAEPLRRAALIARLAIAGPQVGNEVQTLWEMGEQYAMIKIQRERDIEFEMGGRRQDIILYATQRMQDAVHEGDQRLAGTYLEKSPEVITPKGLFG